MFGIDCRKRRVLVTAQMLPCRSTSGIETVIEKAGENHGGQWSGRLSQDIEEMNGIGRRQNRTVIITY